MPLLARLVLCFTLLFGAAACEKHHMLVLDPNAECVVNTPTFERPVDLLFVVDNSGSMREEQAELRAQIPRLMRAFASGDLDGDGTPEHRAVADLHVGVVSTDMGLPDVPGAEPLGCNFGMDGFGDNAALLVEPDPALSECDRAFPANQFLSWTTSGDSEMDTQTLTALVDDVSCLTSLGTQGCGFEMQLEAALKALWPSDDQVGGEEMSLDRPFYDGSHGQGGPDGANAGFLRNEPGDESVIVVVLLTDENDCSSHDTSHFVPDQHQPDTDPWKNVSLPLRCLNAQENLFAVSRYVDGLKALRGGREDLVVFAAVAGVPVDLVEHNVDFTDATARNAYYDMILDDDHMQEVVDPSSIVQNPNLMPACSRTVTDPNTGLDVAQRAFPARRLVQVAQGFGQNGLVESICREDYTTIADRLLDRVFGALERSSCQRE